MNSIKFGTDGWRGIIAKDFTTETLVKIALGVASYLLKKYKEPSIVIGYDTRFSGKFFLETIAKIFASKGIKVHLATNFISSPMISLGVLKTRANMGLVITASHNPAEYNGIKLKGEYGGPLLEGDIKIIEDLIVKSPEIDVDMLNLQLYINLGVIQYIDLETMYVDHIKQHFDIDRLKESDYLFAFDAMYGAAQNVFRRLFFDLPILHCELDPTFKNVPPEPKEKNLEELKTVVLHKKSEKTFFGIAVDGDADRISVVTETGRYLNSHNIILLLIHYLAGYKNFQGKVVIGASSSDRIEKLCQHYGIEVERVKVGFKEVTRIMLKENVLLGGEESGGIAVGSHIPERDGLWTGLTLWNSVIETSKTLDQLMQEVYDITGYFSCERVDLEIAKDRKHKIIDNIRKNNYKSFGEAEVINTQELDGIKFYLANDEWLLIRLSGTEPKARVYAESSNDERTQRLLELGRETLLKMEVGRK
jgi:phosphomannomutase